MNNSFFELWMSLEEEWIERYGEPFRRFMEHREFDQEEIQKERERRIAISTSPGNDDIFWKLERFLGKDNIPQWLIDVKEEANGDNDL